MSMYKSGLVFMALCAGMWSVLHAEIHDDPTFGPGDRKQGYDTEQYTTRSLSLDARIGQEADLMALLNNPPLGLPKVPQPENNIASEAKMQLGRRLFYDRRLSLNDTFSCAVCHIPEQGFTSNELATAVGFEGRSVRRNSPTVYNVAYLTLLFHDGREFTLEQQVWSPMLASNEMANPSIGYVIHKIREIDDYDGLFESAFNGKGPTMETIGMALAVYQRALLSANSRFDRWYYGKQEDALFDQEKKGFEIFTGKGACSACHLIDKDHALFTDNLLHNTGMGFRESMGIGPGKKRVQLAPGVFVDVDQELIESVRQQPKQNDVGRYEVTQNPYDRWKYRTPTLRNIVLTAPYMHNGGLSTLRDVVEFYDQGGVPNELLSPLIKPLNLTEDEINSLIAFLNTLTGDNVSTLVADAFAAPIGDIRDTDPNWANETILTNEP